MSCWAPSKESLSHYCRDHHHFRQTHKMDDLIFGFSLLLFPLIITFIISFPLIRTSDISLYRIIDFFYFSYLILFMTFKYFLAANASRPYILYGVN